LRLVEAAPMTDGEGEAALRPAGAEKKRRGGRF
jgi:hypothetical protein